MCNKKRNFGSLSRIFLKITQIFLSNRSDPEPDFDLDPVIQEIRIPPGQKVPDATESGCGSRFGLRGGGGGGVNE